MKLFGSGRDCHSSTWSAMPRRHSNDEQPLEDRTGVLTLHNRRTERQQRKRAAGDRKREAVVNLAKLPTELLLEILQHLPPLDVFRCSVVSRRFHALVAAHSAFLGDSIIARRYAILARCFPVPRLLSSIAPPVRGFLTEPSRQAQLSIHNRPYQHIRGPDTRALCTCLTCILLWNNLGLVLDFAHWQNHLDSGEAVPVVPRGQSAAWNDQLVERNARIARRAIESPLWHAFILQRHLASTVRSIRRHAENKGNKRAHVDMTAEDAAAGTDGFLFKHGPLSLEFPYQRDEYYLLEAYLPNRWWRKSEDRWVYTVAGQHERDLELVQRFAKSMTNPAVADLYESLLTLLRENDGLAHLYSVMERIDHDAWMADVLNFKTLMSKNQSEAASSARRPLKYYAAVV